MRPGSRKIRRMKSALRRRSSHKKSSYRRTTHKRRTHHRKLQKGGYAQYQNNQPMTAGYQAAGIHLPPNLSALATPVPIVANGGCVDNYRHDINIGTPSKGH